MGIIPQNMSIENKLKEAEKSILQKFLRVLRYCGEMAINEARNNGSYQDRTGNLRASVGYVIVVNGTITDDSFISGEGASVGRELAHRIAQQIPDIGLVVVAGMKYATYVESQGFNVLTSAEQMAKRVVPNLLKQLR